MKVDPIEGTKCRDKFLVQSAKIVAGEGGMGEMSLAEAVRFGISFVFSLFSRCYRKGVGLIRL